MTHDKDFAMTNHSGSELNQPNIHEFFANSCLSEALQLLKHTDLSSEQREELKHCTHAAYYHSQKTDNLTNLVRGLWLLTKTYAVLGQQENTEHYAEKGRGLCGEAVLSQPAAFAYIFDALGTVYETGNQPDEAHAYRQLSIDMSNEIRDIAVKNSFLEETGLAG